MLTVKVVAGRHLAARDVNGKSDPYVVVSSGSHHVKTKVVSSNLNPEWNEEFQLAMPEPKLVVFDVFDHDLITKDDPMGSCSVKGDVYSSGEVIDKWFPLNGKEASGEIHLILSYKK